MPYRWEKKPFYMIKRLSFHTLWDAVNLSSILLLPLFCRLKEYENLGNFATCLNSLWQITEIFQPFPISDIAINEVLHYYFPLDGLNTNSKVQRFHHTQNHSRYYIWKPYYSVSEHLGNCNNIILCHICVKKRHFTW